MTPINNCQALHGMDALLIAGMGATLAAILIVSFLEWRKGKRLTHYLSDERIGAMRKEVLNHDFLEKDK